MSIVVSEMVVSIVEMTISSSLEADHSCVLLAVMVDGDIHNNAFCIRSLWQADWISTAATKLSSGGLNQDWSKWNESTQWSLVMPVLLWKQSSWGQHGAYLGPTGPRWAPCRPCEPCYLGVVCISKLYHHWFRLCLATVYRQSNTSTNYD